MNRFIKELFLRLKMETPPFFRKLSRALVYIGGLCAVPLLGEGAAEQYLNIALYPDWAVEPLKIGAFCGFIGAAIAKLPVCEPEDIKHKL
jgi:hypothetical protein